MSVKVLDEKALAKGGFGGIVGVGQGSANPPRIVHARRTPRPAPKASIALVGKGITFDSGGLCIKPATGMLTMKCDMAGAAAVAATVLAVGRARPARSPSPATSAWPRTCRAARPSARATS